LPALLLTLMPLFIGGCTSYGVIDNPPITAMEHGSGYSWQSWSKESRGSDLTVILSFSGGGTRAAALAYGVLQGLRDTTIEVGGDVDGRTVRLLDEVDYISSVSGGSFTSAYYGLYGDRIFEDFEEDFLLRDVEKHLFWGLANPAEWFRKGGRTEMAIRYYNENVFHGATFADMKRDNAPLILINASDLGHGMRFSFIQEYFNLLCSDVNSFPVAKAVAASSAVPLVFLPVVLENYSDCDTRHLAWLDAARKRTESDPLMQQMVNDIDSLLDKDQRHYVHLVDGGITDNLGLRALYELFTLSGGVKETLRIHHKKAPSRLVIISVNASTDPEPLMDKSNAEPSISETIGAMSDVQLHRYNTATLELMERSLEQWTNAMSTPGHPVKSYFIRIGVDDIESAKHRMFFNQIPTSFSLSKEQVDRLAQGGKAILQGNAGYQQLVADLGGRIDRPR
jgi:NTE family protein